MRVSNLLSALPLAAAVAASNVQTRDGVYKGCTNLTKQFPTDVFVRGHNVYEYETEDQYWSNTEIMNPDCVYLPQSAADLASAIKILTEAGSLFAVRGGGHMGVRGSNNIDDAVLIGLTNLDTLELTDDRSILSLGPAHRWGAVYQYLEQFDLAVPGGRLGPVGVPGLLLAGGVSYHGNQVGWAANSVVNYEVVLAAGRVVNANETANSDLFWALKGGSSNFGIVTRFDIKTLPSRKIWAGVYTVSAQHMDEYIKAIALYSANNNDAKTHIAPAIIPGVEYMPSVILFYDSDTESFPESLKMFTDIPAVSSSLEFKTLAEFAAETGVAVVPGINDVFVAGTAVGTNYDELLKGVSIINSTFFEHLPELEAQVPAKNIVMIQLVWQPIGPMWTKASEARGGNPLGLDASKTYLAYAEVIEWTDSRYNDIVAAWIEKVTTAINKATDAAGLFHPFNYMGDAAGFQSIFPGYGADNHEKLKTIAKNYDPEGVFQNLMPGGFKIF